MASRMPSWIAFALPSWFHPGSTLLGLALGIVGTMYLQFWRQAEEEEEAQERHHWHSGTWWSNQWAYGDPSTKWKQCVGDGNDDDDSNEFEDTCNKATHGRGAGEGYHGQTDRSRFPVQVCA